LKKLSSAVIGLGQIGQGYDYDLADDTFIKTHATGFDYHEAFELVAGVDPDLAQRKRFQKKFNRSAYPNVQSLFKNHKLEVISIGVPTDLHYKVFKEVISCRPIAVLCEKPIASSVKQARRMLELAEENKCALVVNYARRFDPGVLLLKKIIQNEEIGEIYKGTAWYSKGLLNNGSHFVDLLLFLLGGVSEIKILNKGRKWDNKDPEPDVCIRFGTSSIYFLSGREECFFMGDIELVGTQGTIRYTEGGANIEIRKTQPHPIYPGHAILGPDRKDITGCLKRYQWYVLENLSQHLFGKSSLNSDGRTATETLEAIVRIFSLL